MKVETPFYLGDLGPFTNWQVPSEIWQLTIPRKRNGSPAIGGELQSFKSSNGENAATALVHVQWRLQHAPVSASYPTVRLCYDMTCLWLVPFLQLGPVAC